MSILRFEGARFRKAPGAVADPENFGGGGFEAQNLKNSDVFTKIESDFSAEVGNSTVFFAQIQVVSKKKKKKKKKVFTKIESDLSAETGNSNVFFAHVQVVSKEKKKKGLHQNWDWFFAGFVTFRSVGGMHPEMEPNYSKQRLIFRPKSLLLGWWGGDASPHPPPPKSATARGQNPNEVQFQKEFEFLIFLAQGKNLTPMQVEIKKWP